jgi:hypothetical protein
VVNAIYPAGGRRDPLERNVHSPGLFVPRLAHEERAALNGREVEIRRRIATLVESVKDDRVRSHQLFDYVWSMICVRRGLMRVVRVVESNDSIQLVLEEIKSGRQRLVLRPKELDSEIEGLAVQALTKILGDMHQSNADSPRP